MSGSNLVLHRGSVEIGRDELELIPAPQGTQTWSPVAHGNVIREVESRLADAGIGIMKSRYAVSQDRMRMFSTLDLQNPVGEGVALAVGVRNSNDKTFPIGFVCGSRVFVCDNLSFSSEIVVTRRHTRFGEQRFSEALTLGVRQLSEYREVETRRIGLMRSHELTAEQADSLILQAFEREIVSARILPGVVKEWRNPSHPDFEARTVWSLLNAFTEALKPRLSQPQVYSAATMQLTGLLCRDERYKPAPLAI